MRTRTAFTTYAINWIHNPIYFSLPDGLFRSRSLRLSCLHMRSNNENRNREPSRQNKTHNRRKRERKSEVQQAHGLSIDDDDKTRRLCHVSARVNAALGVLGKCDLEPFLNVLENLFILLAADKRNRQPLGTETTSTADTVQVGVRIRRHVVVNGKVDTFNIDTTSENIGSDTDTLVELLELLVTFNTRLRSASLSFVLCSRHYSPLLLANARVHRNTGELTLAQELVQLVRTNCALDEDDNLVELEAVQKFVQLTVLLRFTELDVVLLKTVESKLGVVVHIDFKRVPHELLANGPDVLRERCAKHHDLLVGGGRTENLLDVTAHV